jgi:hypothetical protein
MQRLARDTETVFEVNVENDIIVSIIPGDETAGWKGTLKGLRRTLRARFLKDSARPRRRSAVNMKTRACRMANAGRFKL